MKVVDLNLLVYAVNVDAPHHERARRWWENTLSGDEPVGLPWVVITGFLRLSTRPGLFPHPLTLQQALDVVDGWINHPTVMRIDPGDAHWTVLRELLEAAGVAGNLTTDAHLAALAIENDAELYSSDSDFTRFGQRLRFVNPLA